MTRTHWPAVRAAIAAACVGKLPPAIPLLREEFGPSLIAAGWVNSIFNTLSVCTAALVGVLARPWSRPSYPRPAIGKPLSACCLRPLPVARCWVS